MSRVRNVCFTWNNFPADHADLLTQLPDHGYIVYGYELSKSNTPHLQGYVEFKDKVTFNTLKKRFPKVHWESRKGTPQQAADYCKKEASKVFEEGTMSNSGKRTDLDTVRAQLTGDEGANLRAIVQTATSMQSVKFAEVYLKFHEKVRNFKPIVTWLYGGTGVGKSYRVHKEVEALGLSHDLHKQTLKKWWDGYDGHQVVLIDDIRSTFCEFADMLQLLDRYAYRVEAKGGSRQMLARRMYITSPMAPEYVWSNTEDKQQLLRRIDNIEEILSMTESKVIKGNGIPLYQEEAIVEEASEDAWDVNESDFSCEEVCSTSTSET